MYGLTDYYSISRPFESDYNRIKMGLGAGIVERNLNSEYIDQPLR